MVAVQEGQDAQGPATMEDRLCDGRHVLEPRSQGARDRAAVPSLDGLGAERVDHERPHGRHHEQRQQGREGQEW